MGDRATAIIMGILVLSVISFPFDNSFALDYNKHVTLEDLGILQLAAHDLFNVDRMNKIDFENRKLDLSTIFVDTVNDDAPFDANIIAIGGEARNRENVMLFTVASELGLSYVKLLDAGFNENDAKQIVVAMYHEKLANTYQKTFDEPFPEPIFGESNLQENLAFRTIHDFLPGQIKIDKKLVSTLDSSINGKTLDKKELQQKSSKLDGKFDAEFLDIDICFPNSSICIKVNLLEADRTFGDQFNMEESFDDLLEELEDGYYDKNDRAMFHIRNLMAKGQNF